MRFLLTLICAICALDGFVMAQTPAQLALQSERWKSANILPHKQAEISRIVDRIIASRPRYEAVDGSTRVPWYVIAVLHNMESGGSFRHHLHEGSPLSGRTRWVPVGRPFNGKPPFTWEVSAIDALTYDSMAQAPPRVDWASLSKTLYNVERYNGTGYLRFHPETPSPYLWAGTTIERPGKYIADGKWSSSARSKQIGVASIWKAMEQQRILDFSRLKK